MADNKRAFNKAKNLALAGDYQTALPLLEKLVESGDIESKAALVYLYAFLLRWDDLLAPACDVLMETEKYFTANVFDEFALLIGTMGQETKKWVELSDYIDKNVLMDKLGRREKLVINDLKKFLQKKGDVKKVFPVVEMPERSAADSAKHYRDAVDNVFIIKPKFKDPAKKNELEKHLFALAVVFDQEEEILKSYKPKNPNFSYQDAVIVAKIYLKKGEKTKAWDLIKKTINTWYPVDRVQLMPMELLVEDDFRSLLDEKQREFLLKSAKCGG
ncbi:MAG: hypothetical protein ACRCZE_03170 [Candidatus Altimarinota bacterium]